VDPLPIIIVDSRSSWILIESAFIVAPDPGILLIHDVPEDSDNNTINKKTNTISR
jgi:hypothetical protein